MHYCITILSYLLLMLVNAQKNIPLEKVFTENNRDVFVSTRSLLHEIKRNNEKKLNRKNDINKVERSRKIMRDHPRSNDDSKNKRFRNSKQVTRHVSKGAVTNSQNNIPIKKIGNQQHNLLLKDRTETNRNNHGQSNFVSNASKDQNTITRNSRLNQSTPHLNSMHVVSPNLAQTSKLHRYPTSEQGLKNNMKNNQMSSGAELITPNNKSPRNSNNQEKSRKAAQKYNGTLKLLSGNYMKQNEMSSGEVAASNNNAQHNNKLMIQTQVGQHCKTDSQCESGKCAESNITLGKTSRTSRLARRSAKSKRCQEGRSADGGGSGGGGQEGASADARRPGSRRRDHIDDELWEDRLFTPTFVTHCGGLYFIVDCWHHRILYLDRWSLNISDFAVIDGLGGPHSVACNNRIVMLEDTGHHKVRAYSLADLKSRLAEDRTRTLEYITFKTSERPHRTIYDQKTAAFYVITEVNDFYKFRDNGINITEVSTTALSTIGPECGYSRSFTLADGELLVACETEKINRYTYEQDVYHFIGSYPSPNSLNDVYRSSSGWWYVTSTFDGFWRVRTLEDLVVNGTIIDSKAAELGFRGVPYYVSEVDGMLIVPQIASYPHRIQDESAIVTFHENSDPTEALQDKQVIFNFGAPNRVDIERKESICY